MELVRGITITEYCDKKQLTTLERLNLFIKVCRAIQHAHQKGIIHRDIKPTNVLVTQIDGAAVPKVIDFGVAKATNQKLTEQTLYTAHSQMIGTPLYMSPEQAEMSGVDVDTRSDVYSLGVLLYELLTGTTPFDKQTLKEAGFDEMRRIIREEEPPKPSIRISTLNAELQATVSAHRDINPRKYSHSLKGDLDWIVMKAIEKDRNRRYESASAFAADVKRYLNNEPVEAGPESTWYCIRKFASKHHGRLVTASLVVVSLIVAIIFSIVMAIRATDAEQQMAKRLEEVEQYNHFLAHLHAGSLLDIDLVVLNQFFERDRINLRGNRGITDQGLLHLTDLRTLECLHLRGTNVGDQGMKHIGQIEKLRELNLGYTFVTDAGLEQLARLKNLVQLHLQDNRIDGSAFSRLGNLTRLQYLSLDDTFVIDANLPFLQKLTALRKLKLTGCLLSENAVTTLREALPNCEIIWDTESVRTVHQVADANGAGQQVDLIEQLTNSDSVRMRQRVSDGKRFLRFSTIDGIQFPYTPPPEYDLHLSVVRRGVMKRLKHYGFNIWFPLAVDGSVKSLRVSIDGVSNNSISHSGFAGVDNSDYWMSATRHQGRQLPINKEIVVVLKVRHDALGLEVDGRLVTGWTGNYDELINSVTSRSTWEDDLNPTWIAVGGNLSTEFDVTEITLIPHVREAELQTEDRNNMK